MKDGLGKRVAIGGVGVLAAALVMVGGFAFLINIPGMGWLVWLGLSGVGWSWWRLTGRERRERQREGR